MNPSKRVEKRKLIVMTGTQSHAYRRPRHLAVTFLLVGLLPAVFTHTALADVETPVLRIDCMPELGTVEVYGSNISGERASRNFETIPDQIAKKYGIYDISSYFIVEGENEEPPTHASSAAAPKPSSANSLIIRSQSSSSHTSHGLAPATYRFVLPFELTGH